MIQARSKISVGTYVTVSAAVYLGLRALTAAADKPIDPSCYSSTIKPDVHCPGEEVDPGAAINSPTIFAWTTFAQINQPAFPGNTSDTRRVWETWKSADDNKNPSEAIYLDNGHAPPPWDVKPTGTSQPKRLVPVQQLQFIREQNKEEAAFLPRFIPTNPLSEEVRTNRPAFNFILENQLYNRQGQYKYASSHPNFDFPKASKEVKAIWIEASSGMKVTDYYSGKVADKTYVLVAMHVITKDIPFWHWASFVHKDQNKDPETGYIAPLAAYQDIPPSLKGTPFENYRLIAELIQSGTTLAQSGNGAQVDWISRTGMPTVMGNPHIEEGFETASSCITCHAHSSIGLTGNGSISYNKFPLVVGAVKPEDFTLSGVTYHPLDFLWSLRQAKNFKP
jgi:hypothetical protein